jgi:hypothetical protein
MRGGSIQTIAAMLAFNSTSLGYFINQLPPIPTIPNRNKYIAGLVVYSIFIIIGASVWKESKDLQKSKGTLQSTNSYFARHTSNTPRNKSNHPLHFLLDWKSLFLIGSLHFFPTLTIVSLIRQDNLDFLVSFLAIISRAC